MVALSRYPSKEQSAMNRKRITLALTVTAVAVGVTAFGALAGGGGSGVPAGMEPSGSDAVVGACQIGKLSFASSTSSFRTNAAAMADLPDTTVQFKVGGKVPTCVKVDFTAETITDQNEALVVRAVLDDVKLANPEDVILDGDADEDSDGMWVRSHSTSFVFTNVAPGTHTAKIQYRGTFGNYVTVFRPSTYVQYR
jgi:hypothetical protein